MASLTVGEIIQDRYEIIQEIGRGGFGAVYKATDTALNRIIALKENLNDNEAATRQFHREASMLAGLNHPSLPRVTDHFQVDGQGQYLVMDYIEGKSLQQQLADANGPLDLDALTQWMLQVTQALDYLHKRTPPIVHRDIKPANIIVNQQGRAILVDFGISKEVEVGGKTTMGARAITPGFSPPEQYGVGSTDGRSDLYALGATMYACLTGKNPPESIKLMMGHERLKDPSQINDEISRPVAEVIQNSMGLAIDSRYQTAAELESALRDAKTQPLEDDNDPDTIQDFGYAQTIDQPEAAGMIGDVQSPTQSKPLTQALSGSLPIWAWVLIGLASFMTLCLGTFLVIGLMIPDETAGPDFQLPASESVDIDDFPAPNPIQIGNQVVEWRFGGNAASLAEGDLHRNKFSTMAVDVSTGDIFAATNGQLLRLSRSGQLLNVIDYPGAGFLDDMQVGPDGNLYLLDGFAENNFVRVLDKDLNLVRQFGQRGEGGVVTSGSPTTLVFGPDGLLWLLDYNRNDSQPADRVVKIDPITGEKGSEITLKQDFNISDRLIAGHDQKAYFMIAADSLIIEVDDELNWRREIVVSDTTFIESLTVTQNGEFYVGTTENQLISHLDQNGTPITRFGQRAEQAGEAYPAGVFYDIEKLDYHGGQLYILDESISYGYLVQLTP